MSNEFREAEEAFGRLKERYTQGKISQREFIDTLKQLRIKDESGRFWMIGAQTGRWYYFDGNDWIQAKPPSLQDRRAICIHCGYENDIEAEVCIRCGGRPASVHAEPECPRCGAKLENPSAPCPSCAAQPGPSGVAAAGTRVGLDAALQESTAVIRSFHPPAFFWFFGILGLFAGILFGILVGATSFFPSFAAGLPGFFRDIQGKLAGGIVYTAAGAVLGFGLFGVAGFAAATFSNGILALVGGLRIDFSLVESVQGEEPRRRQNPLS